MRALGHAGKKTVLHPTDATCDRAVFRHGVAQEIGDHGVLVLRPLADKIVIERLVGAGAVKIVGVDHGKGAIDHAGAAGHGMPCAPGLDAPLGNGAALRQLLQLLEDVFYVKILLHPAADGVLEILLDLMLDHEGDLAESGAVGVEERKVDDGVSVLVHGLDLLESAKAAAHTGGQNDKGRFLHVSILCFLFL